MLSKRLTIERRPGESWDNSKFSSAKLPPPYMLSTPVPSPCQRNHHLFKHEEILIDSKWCLRRGSFDSIKQNVRTLFSLDIIQIRQTSKWSGIRIVKASLQSYMLLKKKKKIEKSIIPYSLQAPSETMSQRHAGEIDHDEA